MGTLTITAATANPAQTVYAHTFTVPDTDMTRIIAANQVAANAFYNAGASPTQVFTFVVQQWLNQLSQEVVSYYTQQEIAAIVPITPISAT